MRHVIDSKGKISPRPLPKSTMEQVSASYSEGYRDGLEFAAEAMKEAKDSARARGFDAGAASRIREMGFVWLLQELDDLCAEGFFDGYEGEFTSWVEETF